MDNIKKEFKALAEVIKIDLNDSELDKICQEYHDIVEGLELIKNIDVSNTKVTSFIHDIEIANLTFEELEQNDNPDDVFSNCKRFKNSMVGIKDER